MLFASFLGDSFFTLLLLMWFAGFLLKQFLTKNPDVKDAANNAAKATVLSLISRIFRK